MKYGFLLSILVLAFASDAIAFEWLNDGDQRAIDNAAQASLEYAKTQQATEWINPDTGSRGSFTPTATHQGSEGGVCREYTLSANIDGREEKIHGTACRMLDGRWAQARGHTPAMETPRHTVQDSGRVWTTLRDSTSRGLCGEGHCFRADSGFYHAGWRAPVTQGIRFEPSFSIWPYIHINHKRLHRPIHHGDHSKRHDRHRPSHDRHSGS